MKWDTVFVTGVALLALQAPASAQSLRGRMQAESGDALAGAHIALLDESGLEVRAALSDASGEFSVTAPGAGTFTLRGEAPGYEVVEIYLTGPPARDVLLLQASSIARDLPSSDVSPDRRCRVADDDAARIAGLWTEVRKALRATAHAEEAGLHGREQRTWTRQLDPDDLELLDESVVPISGFRPGPPFRSPPPEELAQFGFIQGGDGEGYSFFAPDTRTLLSTVFAETHCLGFTLEGREEEGWVGLTFRPRFEGGQDVAGTLWIDARTLGPQRLEYRYTALPWSVKTDKVGGQVDFHRLDGGPWVIQRWWIRSPRVEVRNVRVTQWDEPRQRFGLEAVVEEGGEVVRIRFRDGRVERLDTEGG